MMMDASEPIFRPFWAGPSRGTMLDAQNYYDPTRAVNNQYKWVKRSGIQPPVYVHNIVPSGRTMTFPVIPGEAFDQTILHYGADLRNAIPNYMKGNFRYMPIQPPSVAKGGQTPAMPAPPFDQRLIHYYGTGNQFADMAMKLWWAFKIFVMKLLARLGLYKGMLPTNPYDIQPEAAVQYSAPKMTWPDVLQRANNYNAPLPFKDHTTLFGIQMVP